MRFIIGKSIHNHKSRFNWIITLVLLYIGVWVLIGFNYLGDMNDKSIQVGIADEMIRFHVLANSDSEEDQDLKIKVKNRVVEELEGPLKYVKNKEKARVVMAEEMPNIIRTARDVIVAEGYNYEVNVELADIYFPTKIYGDMTFPPGVYEALQIKIGDAKGKNWWCVMFPPLCFVEGTYNVVPDSSKAKLESVLTEEEYTSLIKEGKVKVKAKFKLLKMIKEW